MTKGKIVKILSGMALSAVLLLGLPMGVYADKTGTVAVESAKVRSEAGTTSDTVGAAAQGSTVTITDEASDNAGNTWYYVTLSDGTKGYIRSDLLNVSESSAQAGADDAEATDEAAIEAAESESQASAVSTSQDTSGVDIAAIAVPDGVKAMDLQMASVSVAAGKIRSNASTSDSIVATLSQGTNLVVAGSKTGSDSKTWYYVAFVDGGSQKNGYIRSDLVSLGEVIVIDTPQEEPVEEEPVEAEPEVAVNNDYALVYTDDGTGTEVWYLYNHINNTREKLQELLDFADNQQKVQEKYDSQIKTYRIIVIVLGALLVIAIAAAVIIFIRSRSGMYYDEDYEEDEEEDEDEDEELIRRRERRSRAAAEEAPPGRGRRARRYEEDEDEAEEEEISVPSREPVRQRPAQNAARRRAAEGNAPRRPVTYEEETPAPVSRRPERKPKNFMLDDDDFEFEFLNMDDK